MRLFVYGTLLDPALVTRLTGQDATMQPAWLDGWRRVKLADGPYPTLTRARARVSGALIEVNRSALWRLSAYEGRRYRLTRVTPRVAGGGKVSALAWVARGGTTQDWP